MEGATMPNHNQHSRNQAPRIGLWLVVSSVTLCCICEAVAQQGGHNAKAFECGFVYDKMKGGKSSAATCSYTGEMVFGTPNEPFPAKEHCKTESNNGYEDFINFRIDLVANTVTWDEQSGLAPFYEPHMIEYYTQKEKLSREEATARVKVKRPLIHNAFDIRHTDKIYDRIFTDEINRTALNPPIYIPGYVITFGDRDTNYSIYIPGKNSNAILSQYVGDHDASWVNLRFGKCRTLTGTPP
jgi:hypothetical protein